jgi:acyl-coenzyme A thioesterase PaaI-like protein
MASVDDEELAGTVMRRLQPAPFWGHVGAALVDVAPGRATIRVPLRPEFGRSGQLDGPAHGGIIATAIDMAASCAIITTLDDGEGRTTVDLSVHYLAPRMRTWRRRPRSGGGAAAPRSLMSSSCRVASWLPWAGRRS